MSEICYAVVQELGKTELSYPYPTDIARDNHEKYYRLLQTAADPNCFSVSQLRGASVKEVEKIMGVKDGGLQWKILN